MPPPVASKFTDAGIRHTAKYFQEYCGGLKNAAPAWMQKPLFPDSLGKASVRAQLGGIHNGSVLINNKERAVTYAPAYDLMSRYILDKNPEPEVRQGRESYAKRLLVGKGQKFQTAPVSIHIIEAALFMQRVVSLDDVTTVVDGDIKRNKERANDHILAEQAILYWDGLEDGA